MNQEINNKEQEFQKIIRDLQKENEMLKSTISNITNPTMAGKNDNSIPNLYNISEKQIKFYKSISKNICENKEQLQNVPFYVFMKGLRLPISTIDFEKILHLYDLDSTDYIITVESNYITCLGELLLNDKYLTPMGQLLFLFIISSDPSIFNKRGE